MAGSAWSESEASRCVARPNHPSAPLRSAVYSAAAGVERATPPHLRQAVQQLAHISQRWDHMKRSTVVAGLVALAASWGALADAPKTLHVTQTVAIKAPVSKVWDAIKNFDGLPSWHPAFSKDEIVKGTNN